MLSCSRGGGEHEEDEERMMGLVAPSRNEWPLQRMMGERILMMPGTNTPTSSNSSTGTTDNTAITPGAPTQAGGTHHQAPLKCPRCDSSNTKFCYYNNYSLSQPRHFCKACKRYWTRGGTLRNVPVGGGCRKNKRVKKTSSSTPHISSSAPPPPLTLPPVTSQIDVPAIDLNPLFYDLSWQRMHHPISGCNVYDLQPQMNALGLGFNDEYNHDQTQFQPSSFLHEYPLFGSSSTLSSATAASLLVSSLKQPTNAEDYLGQYSMLHYANLEAAPGANLGVLKEVKVEGDGVNGMGGNWQLSCGINPFEAASTAPVPDSSFMYWNTAAAAWPDAANNCGSSIAPLI